MQSLETLRRCVKSTCMNNLTGLSEHEFSANLNPSIFWQHNVDAVVQFYINKNPKVSFLSVNLCQKGM
jgi:hypothetical protein